MKVELGLTQMFGKIVLVVKPEGKDSAEVIVITEEQRKKFVALGVPAADVVVR